MGRFMPQQRPLSLKITTVSGQLERHVRDRFRGGRAGNELVGFLAVTVVLKIKANDGAFRIDDGRQASQRGVDPTPTERRHAGALSPWARPVNACLQWTRGRLGPTSAEATRAETRA